MEMRYNMKKKLLVSLMLTLLTLLTACENSSPAQTYDGNLTCTLEIRCDTILDNLEKLDPDKASLVPSDGLLLSTGEISFQEGDTVFDVLKREITGRKLHFEYTDASAYGTTYIEGICNLYEFDCGSQSGWEYCVNGVFPSLGCSNYTLSDGDAIQFLYTCDSGADLGDTAP